MTLKEHIIKSEGKENRLYRDTSERTGFEGRKGKVTIGYGYNIDDNGLPDDIIMMLLDREILSASIEVSEKLPWTDSLDSIRRDVLIEMVYNMGYPTFAAFKGMLSALQAGDYERAAQHGLDSLWAKQVGPRAKRLMEKLRTGKEV